MANRHELYRRFGPQLMEALFRIVFIEINDIRARAGLPERTVQQAIDALAEELQKTDKYDWMTVWPGNDG